MDKKEVLFFMIVISPGIRSEIRYFPALTLYYTDYYTDAVFLKVCFLKFCKHQPTEEVENGNAMES